MEVLVPERAECRPTLEHIEQNSALRGRLDGGEFRGEWTPLYGWLPTVYMDALHLKPTQHCWSTILQYKIVFF